MNPTQLRFMKLGVSASLFVLLAGFAQHFFFPSAAKESAAGDLSPETQALLRHNNLGVALMEQLKFDEARKQFEAILSIRADFVPALVNLGIAYFNAQQFEQSAKYLLEALRSDPTQIQARFMLGLIYRNQDHTQKSIDEFLEVAQQDPEDASTQYYLGLLRSRLRDYEKAESHLRKVVAREPYNASAYYNLAIALMRGGKREAGQKQMQIFRQLQGKFGTTTIGLQYLEQGQYSLAIDDLSPYLPKLELPWPTRPAQVRFSDVAGEAGLRFRHGGPGQSTRQVGSKEQLAREVVPYLGSGVAWADFDRDGWLDIYLANAGAKGAPGILLRNRADGSFDDVGDALQPKEATQTMMALWGDVDNDQFPDLYLINYGPNTLFRNNQDGTFTDVTAAAQVGDPGWGMGGTFLDYDHDGDLDIFVANFIDLEAFPAQGGRFPDDFPGADNVLYRNNGDGSFSDVSREAGLRGGKSKSLACLATDYNNSRDIDLYVVNWDGPNQLYSNQRDGSFADVASEVGAASASGGVSAAIGDWNRDSYPDLLLPSSASDSLQLLVNQGRNGRFLAADLESVASVANGRTHSAQFFDFDNDGDLDILQVAIPLFDDPGPSAAASFQLFENRAGDFQDVSESVGLKRFSSLPLRGVSIADYNQDGDLDILATVNGAAPLLLRNDGGSVNNWIKVKLTGTNSNKPGVGTKVEVRSDRLRQKTEIYGGHGFLSQGPPTAHFGLGALEGAEIVRLLWPGGVLQSELNPQINGTVSIQELDRKGTSCPILYVWDGSNYRFQTDFLGGSAYGYLVAPDRYNYPDTDEYIKLDRESVALRNGQLAITLNNQLEEVILFDQLELVTVDHAAGYDIFPDEKLLPSPPYPGFRILTASRPRPPVEARDGKGRSILSEIAKVDRIYPSLFRSLPFKGYAEPHEMILDLGAVSARRVVLLMHAWIDYADSTSNLAASQAGLQLTPPYLQVQDPEGRWVTVLERMGFPAGLPKTMTVDLSGKFLSSSRRVRIVTNMRIHWDQIRVESGPDFTDYRLHRQPASYADLHFRGFPEWSSLDARSPNQYFYERISLTAPWKVHLGGYTRYGDVLELLSERDDRFVITRSGDEVEVFFDLSTLPHLPEGWVRDYLIYVDGFGKDMDPNSASPDTVGPLPYHGMTAYPFPAAEAYPQGESRRLYLERWNTRSEDTWIPALR